MHNAAFFACFDLSLPYYRGEGGEENERLKNMKVKIDFRSLGIIGKLLLSVFLGKNTTEV